MWRWIDLPPVWLAVHLAVLWLLPSGGTGAEQVWDSVGIGLIAAGVLLMVWAVGAMMLSRTTVVPHRQPDALVTRGPFAFGRNPIYLGDVLVMAGAAVWIGPIFGLLLVPSLMVVLEWRFIRPEEARLRGSFGPSYAAWSAKVRRWI